jgi:hypothetical protein
MRTYETETDLLYIACLRARDYLSITSVEPSSEFLHDLPTTAACGQQPMRAR